MATHSEMPASDVRAVRMDDQPRTPEPELRLIYDTAPIGLAFLSPDCRYLHINQRLTEICGLSVADHLGRTVRETVPALADAVEDIVGSIMKTGKPVIGVEVAGLQPDQADKRSWITYWHPLFSADGQIVGINVAAEEITERKRVEAAFRASERQFRTLADSIPQLVWMSGADGRIFWFNDFLRTYAGLSGDTDCAESWTTILRPEAPEVLQLWSECLSSGTNFEAELRLRTAGGQCGTFLTRVYPLTDSSGTVYRWIGTHTDISEQRSREEHVRVIVDELSHRTKNLLTVVSAVATYTARNATSVTEYKERFVERLTALAECHQLLANDQWQGATIVDLFAAQMRPFRARAEGQIVTVGPCINLTPEAVHYLGLAMHELATNAVKHGALSVPEGAVSVQWRLNEGSNTISVRWSETGGPPVSAPKKRGFGHIVIERIVPQALGGRGVLGFMPAGVTWTFEFPSRRKAAPNPRTPNPPGA